MRPRAVRDDVPAAPKLKLTRIVLDSTDIKRSAKFWSKALGYKVTHKSDTFWSLKPASGGRGFLLGLQPTDERKSHDAPNALHLELFADDMEREARRLVKLGASRVPNWPYGDDEPNWIVLQDPDGHEFCIVEK
jgi:catechol 2,3-dioxygenase-like lactoylglutathione lyase family enzyme